MLRLTKLWKTCAQAWVLAAGLLVHKLGTCAHGRFLEKVSGINLPVVQVLYAGIGTFSTIRNPIFQSVISGLYPLSTPLIKKTTR